MSDDPSHNSPAGRHAYCIIAHDRPQALARLVDLIDDPRNDIFIMIDARTPITPFLRLVSAVSSRLEFLENRVGIRWGGFSQIEATLRLFERACKGDYSRIHLLSGSDLPIKTQDYIHRYCDEEFPHSQFVGISPEAGEAADIEMKTRFYYLWPRFARRKTLCGPLAVAGHWLLRATLRLQRLAGVRRTYPMHILKGDNWVSLTRDCCEYIISRRGLIKRMFRYVLCPDEMFIQTLVTESPFRDSLHPAGSLREIDWERGEPYVWRMADVPQLEASECLFARKFSDDVDAAVIGRVCSHLAGV